MSATGIYNLDDYRNPLLLTGPSSKTNLHNTATSCCGTLNLNLTTWLNLLERKHMQHDLHLSEVHNRYY